MLGVRCGHLGTTEFILWKKRIGHPQKVRIKSEMEQHWQMPRKEQRSAQLMVRQSAGRQWEREVRAEARAGATDTWKEKEEQSWPSSLEKTTHAIGERGALPFLDPLSPSLVPLGNPPLGGLFPPCTFLPAIC